MNRAALVRAVDAGPGAVAASAFAVLSLLRRRRVFHPHGVALEAVLEIAPGGRFGAPCWTFPCAVAAWCACRAASACLSGLPDILGVAVRVLADDGRSPAQDLLFATVLGQGAVSKHVLAPAAGFGQRSFSTVLPYRSARGLVVLGLVADHHEPVPTTEHAADSLLLGGSSFRLRVRGGRPRAPPRSVGSSPSDAFPTTSASRFATTRSTRRWGWCPQAWPTRCAAARTPPVRRPARRAGRTARARWRRRAPEKGCRLTPGAPVERYDAFAFSTGGQARSPPQYVLLEASVSVPAHRTAFAAPLATAGRGASLALSRAPRSFEWPLLDALAFPVAVLDGQGTIVSVNRAWCDSMAGTAAEGWFPDVGADLLRGYELNGSPEGPLVAAGLDAVCRRRRTSFDLDFSVSTGEDPVWLRLSARPLPGAGAGAGAVVTAVDVTAYMCMVDVLVERGMRDPLTGLANRALLVDHLQLALDRASRQEGRVALAFVDLDDFKRVNDVHGHAAGDHLLRAVAMRLRGAVRDADTVARIGGDEFIVLFSDVEEMDTAMALAQRLRECLAEPIPVDAILHQVSASIGCTVGGPGATAPALVSEADEAMYRAKGAGKGRIELFGDHLPQG